MSVQKQREGVFYAVPDRDYRAWDGFSSTEAKAMLESPAHYKHYMESPRVEKSAYDDGHIVHEHLLGQESRLVVFDEWDSWRSKDAREARESAYADGLIPKLAHEFEPLREMLEALDTDPAVRELLGRPGFSEVSMRAVDPLTGVLMKGRADRVTTEEGRDLIVDVKTANDANPRNFRSVAQKYHYALQARWYSHIWKLATGNEPLFLHLVVSKNAPYLASVVHLDKEFMDVGERQMRLVLERKKKCEETGLFPGYAPIVHELSPALYYISDIEDLEGLENG